MYTGAPEVLRGRTGLPATYDLMTGRVAFLVIAPAGSVSWLIM